MNNSSGHTGAHHPQNLSMIWPRPLLENQPIDVRPHWKAGFGPLGARQCVFIRFIALWFHFWHSGGQKASLLRAFKISYVNDNFFWKILCRKPKNFSNFCGRAGGHAKETVFCDSLDQKSLFSERFAIILKALFPFDGKKCIIFPFLLSAANLH